MNTSIARNPWRAIWQTATSDGLLVGLLSATAAGLLTTLCLPQMPDADPVAYARWLSEVQTAFGGAADAIQALGLLSITRSFGFRALLALLAAILPLRLVECGDRLLSRAEPQPWTLWFPVLAQAGALLLLLGQLLAYLWGWQVKDLLVETGQRVTLPGTRSWVAVSENPATATHSRGVVAFVEGYEPGVRVTASDGAGQSLGLQRTPQAESLLELTLVLDEEQFFAVPEAGLVVQLAPHASESGDIDAVHARVYRSPPGRLETEQVLRGGGKIPVDDVTLDISSVPHTQITATFNPGMWPTGLGLAFTTVGVAGSVVWHRRDRPTADEEQ
jgi:hypothetical protein